MKKLTDKIIKEVYAMVEARWPSPFIEYSPQGQSEILNEIYEELCRATNAWPHDSNKFWGVARCSTMGLIGKDFPVCRYIEYRDRVGGVATYYDIFEKRGTRNEMELPMIKDAIRRHGLTTEQEKRVREYKPRQ